MFEKVSTSGKASWFSRLAWLTRWGQASFSGGPTVATTLVLLSVFAPTAASAEEISVDFNRDVRPILSDHCFACHGPDEKERKADLRLDSADGLSNVVAAGDVDASELIARIASTDPDTQMPPPHFHKPLTELQIETLKSWVAAGAEVSRHWSFERPVKAAGAPEQAAAAIDYFIDRKINSVGLKANPTADRRVLLRRLCLDLTGLPPSREQLQQFLADDSPDAYERLVDRLLQSHHFGEHTGRYWLDLVRYGDTHGLHLDNYREMWPYRDWVIQAFNANLPYDQFVQRQLAGDLLANATDADRIASGFNRLNVTTNEGGSIYDEVFVRNVIDRTDAFGTIFLGLSTGCAVCHDHKFDPITSQDYYSLSAFFNSLDGKAMDGNVKDHAPVIAAPTVEQREQLSEIDQMIAELQQQMRGPIATVDQAQQAWQRSLAEQTEPRREVLMPSEVASDADAEMKINDDGSIELIGDAAAKDTTTIVAPLPAGAQWQTVALEASVNSADDRVGASSNGNVVLTEITIETTDDQMQGQWVQVPIAYALADVEQQDGPFAISYAIDRQENDSEGWAVAGHLSPGGRTAWLVTPSLIAEGQNPLIRVRLKYLSKFSGHQFRRVRLTLSDAPPSVPENQKIVRGPLQLIGPIPVDDPGSAYDRQYASQKSEFKIDQTFTHGTQSFHWQPTTDLREVALNELPVVADQSSVVVIHQSLTAPTDQKVTLLIDCDDGYVIFLNGQQVASRKASPESPNMLADSYPLSLTAGENNLYLQLVNQRGPSQFRFAYRSPAIDLPKDLLESFQKSSEETTPAEEAAIRDYFRQVHCLHPDWLALVDQLAGAQKTRQKLQTQFATTLVWKELSQPRQAHVLIRGQYDQPGDPVARATPVFLPSFPADAPRDRLGLSRWLTLPEHPLTARVAVNRFWQQIFGIGLVKTSEDFGSQGEPPSHPGLLDWLAVDLQDNGWDVKRLIKSMVMSKTYQRSSMASDEMKRIDPGNRLLARGSRHRLDAEVLRDQALALSGLLVDQPGGPSVKPPQPDGLWKAVGYSGSNTVQFAADSGDKVYRRSVYTFWKRTAPPPQMSTFDAPSRESCTVRRERTNTPLQALLLMNEQQYVEAANHLAKRALEEPGLTSNNQRIGWLFETVTCRQPSDAEQLELNDLLADTIAHYQGEPEQASKLTGTADAGEAAWTILASTLLNLDEVVSK